MYGGVRGACGIHGVGIYGVSIPSFSRKPKKAFYSGETKWDPAG